MKLQDKVAIITGSAHGIGREIALSFAREGARIVIPDIRQKGAEETAAAVEALDSEALAIKCDVADSAQVDAVVAAAIERFGKVDILVNNAGVGRPKPFWEVSDAEWDNQIKVCLYGCFYCSRAVAAHMIERREGKILSISSINGLAGSTGRAAYSSAKGGIIGLTRVMAIELAKHGVNVNAIAPGPINTVALRNVHGDEHLKSYRSRIPFRRLGETGEVADAALFLCSDDSRYITGQMLAVDGGFLAVGLIADD